MPKIVVDTSAVLAVCLEETTRHKVIEATRSTELVAPASLPLEVPNALSSKFKQSALSLEEALGALERFERIPMQQAKVDLEAALRLASELGIYAYDAYVIEAARRHRCPMISLDGGQCEAASRVGVETIRITW